MIPTMPCCTVIPVIDCIIKNVILYPSFWYPAEPGIVCSVNPCWSDAKLIVPNRNEQRHKNHTSSNNQKANKVRNKLMPNQYGRNQSSLVQEPLAVPRIIIWILFRRRLKSPWSTSASHPKSWSPSSSCGVDGGDVVGAAVGLVFLRDAGLPPAATPKPIRRGIVGQYYVVVVDSVMMVFVPTSSLCFLCFLWKVVYFQMYFTSMYL